MSQAEPKTIEQLKQEVAAAAEKAAAIQDAAEQKTAYAEAVTLQGELVRLLKTGGEGVSTDDVAQGIKDLLAYKSLAGLDVVQSGGGKKKKKKKKKNAGEGGNNQNQQNQSKKKKKEKNFGAPKAKKKKAIVDEPYDNITPVGDKKILEDELRKTYNPIAVEAAWYDWWDKAGYFKPEYMEQNQSSSSSANDNDDAEIENFVIAIPPPNVTGSLHLGHALTNAIQDSLVRWHRMLGHRTLWVPGTDHAGIATQTVVEKRIWKNEQKTRHDYGREAFLEKVWEWKQEYHGRILKQLRSLGGSYDWDREVFTMDDNLNRGVKEAFVRMFDQGLIYRSTRLVNWSCSLNTAISDIEVDYVTLDTPKSRTVPGHGNKEYMFGFITDFKYLIDGTASESGEGGEYLTVSTTRPETMLGDTGVAIHPDDPRYSHLHGKFVIHPFDGRKLPIVLDPELVDMELGTGAVKITPAHDPNDYECGKRHNLEMINVLNDDGSMNANCGQFEGLMRFDAREAVIEALKEKGLFVKTEKHEMRLGICSRSKDVIEPLLKPQWFVNCESMAARAVQAVENGDLEIIPSSHETTWFHYLRNIRPWCISRQLWWGHRVPAYFVEIEGVEAINNLGEKNEAHWIAARSEEEARQKACEKFGVQDSEITKVSQDPDVLDTWFSSGLFPFSMLGWPDMDSTDLKKYFPNQLLETGHDILFFWVARMVMMSLHLMDDLPFKQVFLHAMVRDAHGRKMSKSLGNVVDPLSVINGISLEELHQTLYNGNLAEEEILKAIEGQKEDYPQGIERCGTDALRFALCAYTSQGKDVNLDIKRVEGYRHFCNKIWNGSKLTDMLLGKDFTPNESELPTGNENMAERWILDRLNNAVIGLNAGMKDYHFENATTAIYSFFQYDFCDYFLELAKDMVRLDDDADQEAKDKANNVRNTLYTCLETSLRLLHPFMPFVTEELWQHLPRRPNDSTPSIMVASFPTGHDEWEDNTVVAKFAQIQEAIKSVRSMRGSYTLTPRQRSACYLRVANDDLQAILEAGKEIISSMALCTSVNMLAQGEDAPAGCAMTVAADLEVYLYIKDVVDFDKEIAKLEKNLQNTLKRKQDLEKKMNVESYKANIKPEIHQKNVDKVAIFDQEIAAFEDNIAKFKEIQGEGSSAGSSSTESSN